MARNGGIDLGLCPSAFGGVLLASHAYKGVCEFLSMLAGSSDLGINAMDGAAVDWNR